MSQNRRKTDQAEEGAQAADGKTPGKRSWLKFAIIGAAVLVIGGGAAGWFLMHRAKAPPKPVEVKIGPPIYISLDPAFVTNIESDQAERLLQINVQVMTHDLKTSEAIKANDPVIRNNLLLLFSAQKYAEITAIAGREKLRAQALDTVRHAMTGDEAKPESIEALDFTSFGLQ